jgi:hypothetical protein
MVLGSCPGVRVGAAVFIVGQEFVISICVSLLWDLRIHVRLLLFSNRPRKVNKAVIRV